MIRTAVLLTGDRASAEDIVQDAFLGLYRALPRLRDDGRIAGYLRVCVLNGCRSALRARRRAALHTDYPGLIATDPLVRHLPVHIGRPLVILNLGNGKITQLPPALRRFASVIYW